MGKMRWRNKKKKRDDEIEISSPIQGSGYTPRHILKIRESLSRGKAMFKNKQEETVSDEEESASVHHDDDLNIIQTNGWKRQMPINAFDSINDSINGSLNYLAASHDEPMVQIHDDSMHSVSSSVNNSLRNSVVLSNTQKYTNSKFQKQLMVNRLRRTKKKRKYEEIGRQEKDEPINKQKKRRMDLMSSRDLKNEIKRINKHKANTAFNRKNILLSSSVPNLSRFLNGKKKQSAPYKSKFDNAASSESDDDLFSSKAMNKQWKSRGYLR